VSLIERLLFTIIGLLVVAALVFATKLDIGRNAAIPAAGVVEQPRR